MKEKTAPDGETGGEIFADTSEYNVLFVHSTTDEAGLTPFAFRVYCHISRRAGARGKAWPGIISMAKTCKMSQSMVKKSVKELELRGMLEVKRTGDGRSTNTYFITAPSKWIAENFLKKEQQGDAEAEITPSLSNPVTENPSSSCGETVTGLQGSRKGTPLKVLQEGDPVPAPSGAGDLFGNDAIVTKSNRIPDDDTLKQTTKVNALYEAYPRHKQPVPARRAIWKALQKVPFETLLEAVQGYAKHCKTKGTEADFIPYPATWFNAGSWEDKNESTTHNERTKLW